MALGPMIAFTSFDADFPAQSFSFVTLSDFAAGSLIHFTDGQWTGTNFTGEGRLSLTLAEDVPAGTVISIDDANSFTPTSTHGTVELDVTGFLMSLGSSNEVLYAYAGTVNAPTAVIAAISNAVFAPGALNGTGLVEGVNAISLANIIASADVAAYNGPRIGPSSFADFLSVINNPANWIAQDGSGDQGHDGAAPDLPFSTAGFTDDPNAQVISFAPGSLSVSQAEGDSGTTTLAFTVQRTGTGGTTGEVSFSGTIETGDMDAADFGGSLPLTFSAVIPEGAASVEVTVAISADTRFELDEAFTLNLKTASNPDAGTVIGADNSAAGTVLNDDTVQFVNFAADSLAVEQAEGDSGTTLLTFVVERSGTAGLVGALDFSGTLTAEGNSAADAADFGGAALPIAFSGTFLDGEATAIATIEISGDTYFEAANGFILTLETLFNASANTALGPNIVATGTIVNDDAPVIEAGQTLHDRIVLTGDDRLTIEYGGTIDTVSGNNVPPITILGPATDVLLDNSGRIDSHEASRAIYADFRPAGSSEGQTANAVIWNRETGVITGDNLSSVIEVEGRNVEIAGTFTIHNAGQIIGGSRAIKADMFEGDFVLNNYATGLIEGDSGSPALRGGGTTNNWGTMRSGNAQGDFEGDGIDFRSVSGTVVNNFGGGLIEGGHHAVTGEADVTVFNDVGGTMIGYNGSAVNIDNDGDVEDTVFVTNRGAMEGRSAEIDDSDGDAIDVDGLLQVDNYGTIKGLGHEGYHKGEPNVSEGIAIGGGVINNHAGGEIYGYGRGIQVDNSSNENALGTTTIVNAGLIHGDGHRPEGVAAEDLEPFDLRGNEAINLVGTYADSLTNTGTIRGGVSMGGGDDLIVNKGTMTATGGSAVNLGDGNDTFEAHAGSTVTGTLDGGNGNDTLKLIGPGVGSLGAVVNVENLAAQGGIWTLQSGGHATVTVATGAMVMSQLKLNDQGEMTVAAGGSVLVTNGSDAIVAEGSASIENTGLIQALGMIGTTPAKAVTINGGEITNKAGGIILAQGAAITTGAAAVAGVEITNEGMIQSLSGRAIALVGDQADTVTNKSMIMGSVDLGAGDDTLTIYTASSITGPMIGGTGEDTIRLSATNPASTGTFGTANGFEALVAEEGSWSVAAGAAAFSDITVERGATITSQIVLSGEDKLTVEEGGAIYVNQSVQSAVLLSGASTDVIIENAGQIRSGQNTSGAIGGVYTSEPHSVTIRNHESGQIVAEYDAAIGIRTNPESSGTISIENAGLIESFNGNALQLQDVYGSTLTVNNTATGMIRAGAGQDTVRIGTATLINAGTILAAGMADSFSDAVDFQTSVGGVVNNLEGGLIEGARHGITGKRNVTINNEEGATIYGRNGSGVNFDTEEGRDEAFVVTNHGTIRGAAVIDAPDTFESDIDGDGVDVDYTVLLHNYGVIEALGAKGYKDGFENFSEGVAAGGGEIYNHEGGVIFSVDNGILVDDGEEGSGYAATLIENEGTIEGRDGYGIKLVGEFNDTITNKGTIKGGSGLAIDMGAGDDTLNAYVGSSIVGAIVGGDGTDTAHLLGTGIGSLGSTTGFENLVVQSGTWSVTDGAVNFSDITIEDGATVTSGLIVDGNDHLVVEAGGALVVTGDAITWQGAINGVDVVIDNAGLIEASGRVLNTEVNSNGNFTFNNLAGGVVHGSFNPRQEVRPESIITFNNAGLIEDDGRIFDLKELVKDGAQAVINNLAGGVIQQTGGDGEEDVMRLDDNTVVNNWGTIISQEGSVGGGDALDFDSGRDSSVHNYAGGLIEGSRHAVTGKQDFTIVNEGTMIGRNGSAVNFDTNADELVTITNRGTMEGRSAELSDSDGDAIDVDGLVQILNYGRIAGLGAEGYHDGEPNVSEGIAVGGGSIVNNADAVIYGYGRGIQVDNSSNSNALGVTTIVNDGLIQGDGHGPEGVDPADAAQFDLRGNEAINLVGDYEDFVGNNSTGRIVGGISMGGGRDTLNNSGSIIATGGSAIDMGAGNDQVNLYVGATVVGTILLGAGDDVALATSSGSFVIDGGDGSDTMAMDYTYGGDDTLIGGAGNDYIYGGAGEDRIDGGLDNDTLYGNDGDDLIQGGDGNDYIDGGADDDAIFGDGGHDTIIGGLGNDTIKGNAGNDVFVVTTTADGRDSYDGGEGIDTLDFSTFSQALNLTLRDGATTFATDTIENIENVIGGSGADRLTGNALGNALTGNAGADTLKGGAGNDTLDGGEGSDILDGGADNDQLAGGLGDDELKGAAGNDDLDGGEGADALNGGAGNDFLFGGAGADTLTGGTGFDQFIFASVGDGIDTITDFKVSGASEDQIVLSASMFENFSGDDAFDLIGSGYMRTVTGGGSTQLQIDVDGGGDSFVTLAVLNGTISNGVLADHVIIHQDLIA